MMFNLFHMEKEVIYVLDLRMDFSPVEAGIDVGFRKGTVEDINALEEKTFEFDKKGKKYVLDRLDKGDDFILVTHGGRVVGYHLVMKGAMEFSMRKIFKLSSTQAYLYKGYVVKSFRGKGIIGALILDTAFFLKKEGFEELFVTVSVNNFPMLRVIGKMNFRPVGAITLVRILGIEIPFVSKKTIKGLRTGS